MRLRHLKDDAHAGPWDLEVHQIEKDEGALAAIMGAGITPREKLDQVAESRTPSKGRVIPVPPNSLEMLEVAYSGYLVSLMGLHKTLDRRGSCGLIFWKFPEWRVAVDDAEYGGMIRGITMALEQGGYDLVAVGDSRIAMQQAQGLISCNQISLQSRLAQFEALEQKFRLVRLVHVKREYNQAADYLTTRRLTAGESVEINDPLELTH
ncbi:hypothetical protein F442_15733 [Phytophthora nicotianae P10297]|uniref:RNase H type-1 domain-containing protein n=2 Tax=Phytophthora nicotianae TaxID=4792 RepID=V9EGX3_PHYNI|nr:hypothetical protein F443_15892 [Phytophthora nicotianae P1569]ETP36327.1 hypothetical protein F442_15733 [Phytophthora nicotianae P10297]